MSKSRVQQRVEYALYRAFKSLLLGMSHERVRAFGRAVGRVAFRVDRKRRRLGLANVATAVRAASRTSIGMRLIHAVEGGWRGRPRWGLKEDEAWEERPETRGA